MICKPPEVPLKKRWLLYAGAWGAAFLSFFIPALLERRIPDRDQVFLLFLFSWVFPMGLIEWFDTNRENVPLIGLIWLAYLVHGFFTLRSRNRVRFYLLLLILAVILSFNVIGCHRITSKHVHFGSVEPSSPARSGFLFRCDSRPITRALPGKPTCRAISSQATGHAPSRLA